MKMGKTRRRRDEREPVGIVTQEWVENNSTRLTERDVEILKLLKRFPLLNSEQLLTLTPGAGIYRPFYESNNGQKRLNARLRMLFDLHFINKWSPRLAIGEGTSKQFAALDRAGIKYLNLERRIRYDIPQNWRHQSMVMDLYCAVIKGNRRGDWESKYLEPERKQASTSLIPDLIAIIKKDGKGVAFFIEVDRSEKRESDEKKKLRQYRDWYLSKTWVEEQWAKVTPKPFFPVVLYLFDETKPRWRRRASTLKKEAKELGLKSVFIGYHEFEDYLEEQLEDAIINVTR
jgi:hypothetical protein